LAGAEGCNVPFGAAASGQDLAGEDRAKAKNGMENCGFAGAVRADQTKRLPFADRKIETVKDLHLAITGAQIFELQKRLSLHQRLDLIPGDRLSNGLGLAINVID